MNINNIVKLDHFLNSKFSSTMFTYKEILNMLFPLILVQMYMVDLGTAAIAANAIATSLLSIAYAAPQAVGNLATTVIGQCIGATKKGSVLFLSRISSIFGVIVHTINPTIILTLCKSMQKDYIKELPR